MERTVAKEITEKVQAYLGNCSQEVLCRYVGITSADLTKCLEGSLSGILSKDLIRRLNSLLKLLEFASDEGTLDHKTIHRLLTLPAHEDNEGWKIDLVTAIRQGYPEETLIEIYRESMEEISAQS